MTDREKAIVMAHTGICMLTGDKFQIYHKYIEDILGRPIWTHEIGSLADEIKEKSKADFIALCADEEPYKAEEDNVFDKIRAEIEAQRKEILYMHGFGDKGSLNYYCFGLNDGFKYARDILDKYKAESEGEK